MVQKYDLPNASGSTSNYTAEQTEYERLYKLKPRTQSGNISFTSSTSGTVYNTLTYSGGLYANQGEQGMLNILKTALDSYLITASDYNNLSVKAGEYTTTTNVGNAYTTVTPIILTTGLQIRVKINATSTGAITINGVNCYQADGNVVSEVIANGIYSFTYDGTSFFLTSGGGLSNFFGDGSDGAFNPATILANATAPNGGTVANLWDMNAGTLFTTGSLTAASDCVLFQIDFGDKAYIYSDNSVIRAWVLRQLRISTGTRTVALQWSDDNIAWTEIGNSYSLSSTTGIDYSFGQSVFSKSARYWRVVLKAGGSACTVSCQGCTINWFTGEAETTKVWNIIYPSALNGPAVIKQFSSLTLPAGYSMTVEKPCQGLVIYCQGNAVINGTIDMSKKAGLAPNGNIIPMPVTKKAKKTAKTSALLHLNGDATDATGRLWNPNVAWDTTNKKFGSACASFNGTSSYIGVNSLTEDFSFGGDDFTIDFWVRFGATGAMTVMEDCDGSGSGTTIQLSKLATSEKFKATIYTGTTENYVVSTTAMSLSTWYHIAFVRNGSELALFINGTKESISPIAGGTNKSQYNLFIGRRGSFSAYYLNGQIDEFRIIKGKAMWTANFTPPTAEYTYTATYIDEPKTFEKYLQLTTVLQALRGGSGGNGGYGGGSSGSTTRASGGIGGAGRVNQGGLGGGGGGGEYSTFNAIFPATGGSISYSELGSAVVEDSYAGTAGAYTTNRKGANGCGGGGVERIETAYALASKPGACFGAGGGGTGARMYSKLDAGNGEYAGGFICIIVGGNISGSGTIKADGGNGGSGTAANSMGSGGGGGGGGGGAGGGVIEELYAGTNTFSGTRSVSGGSGGSGGAGYGTGEAGGAGSSGGIGTIHLQQL